MSSVDDRIVNMQFNNRDFTKNVDQSKRDLTGLENVIAKTGRSKGMTDLNSSVQAVTNKFSAMQVAGVTALATIVSKATTAGLGLLKNLTIAPLMDGFKEYQTNLNSVQTIMANTGKDVKTVNKYLEELNRYSDQTIYNFSEMARNIGTFTAAGVELNTATSAIKGISNLAALSGSNSQQASTAMYQLSQAIAAGRVNLQDWNSVVNAGMAGKQFKSALARTAVAMGKLSSDAVKVGTDVSIMGESFRESISAKPGQESWLSSDVLVKTLSTLDGRFSKTRLAVEGYNTKQEINNELTKERNKLAKEGIKYSDEEYKKMLKMAEAAYASATTIKTFPQLMDVVRESIGSMWAGAFQIIMGDFEKSKKLWTNVGEVITGPNGILSNISKGFLGTLKDWEQAGGRRKILRGLTNMFKGLGSILGVVKDAFQEVFPPGAANALVKISQIFVNMSKNMVPAADTLENIKSIFGGLFAVLHIGFTVFKGISNAFRSFINALFEGSDGARGGILSLAGSVGEVLIAIDKWITQGGKLQTFLSGIGTLAGTALRPIVSTISLIISGFAALASGKGIGAALGSFKEAKSIFSEFMSGLIKGLDEVTAPLDFLKDKVANFAVKLIEPFDGFMGVLEAARLKIIEGLGLDTVLPTVAGITEWFDGIRDRVKTFINDFDSASIPLENFGDAIDYVVEKVQLLLDKIDFSSKLDSVKNAASGLMDKVSGGAVSKAGASDASAGEQAAAVGTAAIGGGVDKTAAAFEKLGSVMSVIGGAIQKIFDVLGDAVSWVSNKVMDMFPDDALEWANLMNILISGALIKKLFFSKGLFETLGDSIKGIGKSVEEAFGGLTETLGAMQTSIKADTIKSIAIAVAIMVASLVALSFIPADKLKTSLGTLTILLAQMALALKAISIIDSKVKFVVVAAGLMMMALAVAILAGALALLGNLPFDVIKQGLIAIALMLSMLTLTMLGLDKMKESPEGLAGSLLVLAIAMNVLGLALKMIGNLPLDVIKQGLGTMALALGALVLTMLAMDRMKESPAGLAGSILVLALAMNVLAASLAFMGNLPMEVIQKGLGTMALALGALMLTMLGMDLMKSSPEGLAGSILVLAIAMGVLASTLAFLGALPMEVIKQGLISMALGLATLILAAFLAEKVALGLAVLSVTMLSLGAALMMAGTGVFLFASGLAILAVAGTAAIAVLTLAIAAFILMLPQIAIQIAAAFVAFVQAIALAAPKIRKAMSTIFREMLGVVRDAIPEIGKLIKTLIATAIDIIQESVPRWVEMGFTVIDEFLKSAANHVPSIVDSAVSLVTYFIDELASKAVDLANAGLDMLVEVMDGLSDAIENSDRVRDAAINLARTFVDELKEALFDFVAAMPMPDIPMPSVGGLIDKMTGKNKSFGAGERGTNVMRPGARAKEEPLVVALRQAGLQVAAAIEASVRLLVGATSGKAYNLATNAKRLQKNATYQSTRAEVQDVSSTRAVEAAQNRLDRAESIKNKAKRKAAVKKAKAQMAAANKQRANADRLAAAATAAQEKADLEAQKASDEIAYNKADYQGKGDIRSQQGQDLADRAQALLAEAQAKSDEAKRLAKGSKKDQAQAKKLRKEAAKEAAESKKLALEAQAAQRQALSDYAAARKVAALDVIQRMSDIRKQQADRNWQDEYDKADDNTKIAMLEKRASDNEAAAKTAAEAMEAALTQGEAIEKVVKAGGAVSEAKLAELDAALTAAETQSQLAWQAADQAEADREEIKRIQDALKGGTGTTGGNSGTEIAPSRTALEDAAKAVDRYTASVRQAEEMAQATPAPITFEQNNYSPEALSASEIYRQTNNLVSIAELKMGVTN